MKDKNARLMIHAIASRLGLSVDFGNIFYHPICSEAKLSLEEQVAQGVYYCDDGHLHKLKFTKKCPSKKKV